MGKGKLYFLLALVLILVANLFGFNKDYNDSWGKQGFNVKQSRQDGVNIIYSINKFGLNGIKVDGESLSEIVLSGAILPNDEGMPNLPGYGRYIALPNGATASVKIVKSRKEVFENIDIIPAARIPFDTENIPAEYKKDVKRYSTNALYPSSIVRLSDNTEIRGVNCVKLDVVPFQYNPVTKQLIAYRDIEVEVSFKGGSGSFGQNRLRSIWWDSILDDTFINYSNLPKMSYDTHSAKGDGCDYLIVIPDDATYLTYAQKIKNFRMEQGINTRIVTITEIGGNTVSAIESYIDDVVYAWSTVPSAILLMADYGTSGNSIISPSLPHPYQGTYITDNQYADVSGNNLPDIVFARMAANNEAELKVMTDKFINYETNPPTSAGFYDHPITAMGWQTERWFQLCSEIVNGYFRNKLGKNPVRENAIYGGSPSDGWSSASNTSSVVSYFGESGTNYVADDPSYLTDFGGNAARVNADLNAGAFLLQHRDHGGETGWGQPDYGNSDINGLTNTDLSFIFSINCLTGRFDYSSECFAEKFHKYTYNNQPAGALGLIAATQVSYSFVNDTFVWGMYDDMWSDFLPDYGTAGTASDKIMPAFANAYGKYFLEQSSWAGESSKVITYNLFHHHGDAFINLYSEVPQNLTVTAVPITTGNNFAIVSADEGATIALTTVDAEGNAVIIGTGIGTGASQNIVIDPQTPASVIKLTVTKQNYFRHSAIVPVQASSGPYVVVDSYSIVDGNNNLADFGETIKLTTVIKNVGSETSNNIELTLSTESEAVSSVGDNSASHTSLAADASATLTEAFELTLADDVEDQTTANLAVAIVDDSRNIYNSNISFKVNAPALSIGDMTIDDSAGNGDGFIDPGETVVLTFPVLNDGHAETPEGTITLSSSTTGISIADPSVSGTIVAGGTVIPEYTVTASASMNAGDLINFNLAVVGGAYTASKDVEAYICGTVIYGIDWFEDFSAMDELWTKSTEGCVDKWEVSTTNNAGGESPEIKLGWQSGAPSGVTRLITPALNTQGLTPNDTITINFKHYYNYYSTEPEIKLQVSNDGETWVDAGWNKVPTGDLTESVTISVLTNIGSKTYYAWVLSGDMYEFDYWYIDDIAIIGNHSGIIYSQNTPEKTTLYQNYPNPFNPTTTISFFNKAFGKVNLGIYNAKGQLVQNLVNKNVKAGYHAIDFNAAKFNSGVYFYMLKTANSKIVKKMLLVK